MIDIDARAPRGQEFFVHEGPTLPTIRSLLEYLAEIPAHTFAFHTREGRHDFCHWVDGVFHENALAKKMCACTTREDLQACILDYATPKETPVPQLAPMEVQRDVPTAVTPAAAVARPAPAPAVQPVVQQGMSDAEFSARKEEYAGRNEALQERFDEIARQLQESIKDPLTKEEERMIEQYTEQYQAAKAKTSELRKHGKDAFIASLLLRQFNAKLIMAKTTRSPYDWKAVRALLQEIAVELREAEQHEDPDVREQVLRMAGIRPEKMNV